MSVSNTCERCWAHDNSVKDMALGGLKVAICTKCIGAINSDSVFTELCCDVDRAEVRAMAYAAIWIEGGKPKDKQGKS